MDRHTNIPGEEATTEPLTGSNKDDKKNGSYGAADPRNEKEIERSGSGRANRPRLIEPLTAMYAFTIISIAVLNPQYLRSYLKAIYEAENAQLDQEETTNGSLMEEDIDISIQQEVASWQLYFVLCDIPPIITSLLVVGYTDETGRKPGLYFMLLCEAFLVLCYVIVSVFSLPLAFLLIGHIVSGIGGSKTAALGLMAVYISDVTSESKKTTRLVILFITWLGCGSTGLFLTGVIATSYGFTVSYLLLFITISLGVMYSVFLLPESLPVSQMVGNRENDYSLK